MLYTPINNKTTEKFHMCFCDVLTAALPRNFKLQVLTYRSDVVGVMEVKRNAQGISVCTCDGHRTLAV
jgi:hypothetical protein